MPLDLPERWLGRPVKPLALAAAMTMAVIIVINVLDRGVAGAALWGDFLAVAAGGAMAALSLGWWARSQRLAEWGLLLATGVWFTRAMFGLLTDTAGYAWAMSLSWTVALGGAYLLERVESLTRLHRSRRLNA